MLNSARGLIILTLLLGFSSLTLAVVPRTDYPQGALWWLREAGQKDQADALEKKLTNLLQTGSLAKMAPLSDGVSESFLVQFDGNVFAVLKGADPERPASPNYELAAYRMDRRLELNMVPLTVLREVDGTLYSLQLFMPSKNVSYQHSGDFFDRGRNLNVFDSMLANGDRDIETGHNFLVAVDGRYGAFDHGRVLAVESPIWPIQAYPPMLVSTEFKEATLRLSDQEISADLRGLIPPEKIRRVQVQVLLWKRVFTYQNLATRPGVYRMSQAFNEQPYARPAGTYYDFHDYFKMKKILENQKGPVFSEEAMKLFQEANAQASRPVLAMIALKNWPKYSTPLKNQLLQSVWSHLFRDRVSKNTSAMADVRADVMALDPDKGRIVLKQYENTRARVFQCRQIFNFYVTGRSF